MVMKLTETTQALSGRIDERLEQISGKVNERLDEGFKKTNETFTNVMTRLATIDEAQRKIETLTGSVVSPAGAAGDKRPRGAFGEVQLEQLVRNLLPETAFAFQYTFSRGVRADCVLKLPLPTGIIAIDSKFPLETMNVCLWRARSATRPRHSRRMCASTWTISRRNTLFPARRAMAR
jgi:DNA recombination protein RmuC